MNSQCEKCTSGCLVHPGGGWGTENVCPCANCTRTECGTCPEEQDSLCTEPALFLLFNHRLTEAQEADAQQSLGVDRIVAAPADIQTLWSQVPPEIDILTPYLTPVFAWLEDQARPGDFVLIQGEFGATCLAVKEAHRLNLIPVYSTTSRQAMEEHLPDGRVEIRHTFSHVRYRQYGA